LIILFTLLSIFKTFNHGHLSSYLHQIINISTIKNIITTYNYPNSININNWLNFKSPDASPKTIKINKEFPKTTANKINKANESKINLKTSQSSIQ
jgi:hypothetical protein